MAKNINLHRYFDELDVLFTLFIKQRAEKLFADFPYILDNLDLGRSYCARYGGDVDLIGSFIISYLVFGSLGCEKRFIENYLEGRISTIECAEHMAKEISRLFSKIKDLTSTIDSILGERPNL